jgi:hypothetical protein
MRRKAGVLIWPETAYKAARVKGAEDPDRDPQREARVGLALPPVARVRQRHERARAVDPDPVRGRKTGDLDQRPLGRVALGHERFESGALESEYEAAS